MQNIKIQHFDKTYPNTPFPWYRSLDHAEATSIRREISKRLNLKSIDPIIMTTAIDGKGVLLEGSRADDKQFQPANLLSNLKIQPRQNVFINWSRYDVIDEIGFSDLNKYFSDIWYPGPDDIDIFDSSFRWILSISPEGYIKLVKTAEEDS